MRNNLHEKIIEISHFILECFIRVVSPYMTAPKVLLHKEENFWPIFVLTHRETCAGFNSYTQLFANQKRDVKTPFSVYISGNIIVHVSICWASACDRARHIICIISFFYLSHHCTVVTSVVTGFVHTVYKLPTVLPSVYRSFLEKSTRIGFHRYKPTSTIICLTRS